MEDKILSTKKELKRVLKNPRLTRLEKYNLAKEKASLLDENETKILLKECYRDFEDHNRRKDMKDLVSLFFTGIGLIFTVFGIFFKQVVAEYIASKDIILLITIYVVVGLVFLTYLQASRSKNMNLLQYMIDILEE